MKVVFLFSVFRKEKNFSETKKESFTLKGWVDGSKVNLCVFLF